MASSLLAGAKRNQVVFLQPRFGEAPREPQEFVTGTHRCHSPIAGGDVVAVAAPGAPLNNDIVFGDVLNVQTTDNLPCRHDLQDRPGCHRAWKIAVAVSRAVRSATCMLGTLVGAALATLLTVWALYPICTSCGGAFKQAAGRDVPLATATGARVNSTLRINQLQVGGTGRYSLAMCVYFVSETCASSFVVAS